MSDAALVPPEAALESPAYPAFLRVLAVVIVVDVVGLALWSLPALRAATWSAGSLAVLALAGIGVVWMGTWVVRSRTRLDGDVLTQTWLWNRRAHAGEVVLELRRSLYGLKQVVRLWSQILHSRLM